MSDSGRLIGETNPHHPNYIGPRPHPGSFFDLLEAAEKCVAEMHRYTNDESDDCDLYPHKLINLVSGALREAAEAARDKMLPQ